MTTAIVIGGGIAGCSTAYSLAKKGIEVTLIERNPSLASEASGNPIAVLYPRLTGQDTALEKLNLLGYQYTLNLLKTLGFERCQYLACGVAQLAINTKQVAKYNEIAQRYTADNLLQLQNATELSAIAGISVKQSGLYFPEAGGIHLPNLCKVLTDQPNIHVITNTKAVSIQPTTQQTWRVLTNSKIIAESEIVVIANANDAAQFDLSAHIPLIAIRGQISLAQASDYSMHLRTILCGEGYISPAIDGAHCLGATFSADDNNTSIRSKDHESNLQLLKSMSNSLYQELHSSITSGRVAWRSQTPDYLPAVGQLLDTATLKNGKYFYNDQPSKLPWSKGLYVNLGHGAKGFLSAPLCAEIIARDAASLPNDLPVSLLNALQANRFILRKMGLKQLAQHLIAT